MPRSGATVRGSEAPTSIQMLGANVIRRLAPISAMASKETSLEGCPGRFDGSLRASAVDSRWRISQKLRSIGFVGCLLVRIRQRIVVRSRRCILQLPESRRKRPNKDLTRTYRETLRFRQLPLPERSVGTRTAFRRWTLRMLRRHRT